MKVYFRIPLKPGTVIADSTGSGLVVAINEGVLIVLVSIDEKTRVVRVDNNEFADLMINGAKIKIH